MSKVATRGGIGFFPLLFIVLACKLFGANITWFWVIAPLWMPLVVVLVICGLAGDFCVLETLKNLAPVNPMIFLDGVASLDGGVKLNEYVESNGVRS